MLTQALLRRGLPIKLVAGNGATFRANTLQGVCTRLGIRLVVCRPYVPQGNAKPESFWGRIEGRHDARA